MQRFEGLVAECAFLALIPLRNDVPDQAILWIRLDLLEAILTAVRALRPARASAQMQRRFGEEGAERSLFRIHIHGFDFMSFRAGNQPLPAIIEKRAKARNGAKDEKTHRQGNDDKSNEHRDRHRSPPAAHSGLSCARLRSRPRILSLPQ